ncbi:MAG: PEF-CTERM sorting domain-containing protein [Methanosarcinales archaeon]|nr:PEF-CTERM sorting domain-containing protein [Methanosarcinales archaeon]
MNKVLLIALLIAGLVGMIGTVVADPARIDIDPTTNANPLYHPLDGSTVTYPVEMSDMIDVGGATRYIEITASSGLISARIYNPSVGAFDITANGGSTQFITFDLPGGVTTMTFDLDVTTSNPGEVTIKSNYGTVLEDSTVAKMDFGSASSYFDIPEFPTIALPIAAIIGLMFIVSSRKREE